MQFVYYRRYPPNDFSSHILLQGVYCGKFERFSILRKSVFHVIKQHNMYTLHINPEDQNQLGVGIIRLVQPEQF